MDEELKVCVHFVSGSTLDLSIEGFQSGQFVEWCEKCLAEGNELVSAVVSEYAYINVEQIEYIEEITMPLPSVPSVPVEPYMGSTIYTHVYKDGDPIPHVYLDGHA